MKILEYIFYGIYMVVGLLGLGLICVLLDDILFGEARHKKSREQMFQEMLTGNFHSSSKRLGHRPGFPILGAALVFCALILGVAKTATADPLSAHFKSQEFACHHCGHLLVSDRLLSKLEALRAKLNAPIQITSGYRCPAHNTDVGGARKSQHILGRAADIKVKGYTPAQVALAAKELGFAFVKTYPSWVHVDVREAN